MFQEEKERKRKKMAKISKKHVDKRVGSVLRIKPTTIAIAKQ